MLNGCTPINCTVQAPNETSGFTRSKMMDRLMHASMFAWLTEQSLFHVVDGKPEILHFFSDGWLTRELMASRGRRATPLTSITESSM